MVKTWVSRGKLACVDVDLDPPSITYAFEAFLRTGRTTACALWDPKNKLRSVQRLGRLGSESMRISAKSAKSGETRLIFGGPQRPGPLGVKIYRRAS